MTANLLVCSAATPDALGQLCAFATDLGQAELRALDLHLARPRYRPALTRIAEQDGAVAGYALIGHARLRLGAATLEAGQVEASYVRPELRVAGAFEALLGDCLRTLVEEGLPLAALRGPAADYAPFGFAEYRLSSTVELRAGGWAPGDALHAATADDLDDLAALYAASYGAIPLAEARALPDWRAWLADDRHAALVLRDTRGRGVAYAAQARGRSSDALEIGEAAAADAGAARTLCVALLASAHARGLALLRMALAPWHVVGQAALHLGGSARIARPAPSAHDALAGVVDLPAMLEALAPEFERRLARSRYAGWGGNVRIEIETERITLALDAGRATVIDGSRPADVRLRRVELRALAQLCLGYRAAADLRATGGLDCDDSALGLLDALFPTVFAVPTSSEF